MIALFIGIYIVANAPTSAAPILSPDEREAKARATLGTTAGEWTTVAIGATSVGFVNTSDVKNAGTAFPEAWVLTVYIPKETTASGKAYGSSMRLMQFGCKANKMRMVDTVLYQNEDRSGEVIGAYSGAVDDWTRIVPGTIGESSFRAVRDIRDDPPLPSLPRLVSDQDSWRARAREAQIRVATLRDLLRATNPERSAEFNCKIAVEQAFERHVSAEVAGPLEASSSTGKGYHLLFSTPNGATLDLMFFYGNGGGAPILRIDALPKGWTALFTSPRLLKFTSSPSNGETCEFVIDADTADFMTVDGRV